MKKHKEGHDLSFHLCTGLVVGEVDPHSLDVLSGGCAHRPMQGQAPGLGWPFTCALLQEDPPQPRVKGSCFTSQHFRPVGAAPGEPLSRQEIRWKVRNDPPHSHGEQGGIKAQQMAGINLAIKGICDEWSRPFKQCEQ